MKALALAVSLFGITLVGKTRADDDERPGTDTTSTESAAGKAIDPHVTEPSGFDGAYSLGGTLTMNDNRGVVGQTSGTSATFGYKFDGQATYVGGPHEWRNTLFLAQGLTRTAKLPVITKSQDLLRFETIYLRRVRGPLGTFVRLAGDGPLLAGYDDRASPQTYRIVREARPVSFVTTSHLKLTNMARPFNVKESLGLFGRLLRRDETNLEVRAGVGARHTFADGELAILDDPTTGATDVAELDSFHQVGPEAAVAFWGAAQQGRIVYRAGLDAMVPSYRSRTDLGAGASALHLTNLDVFATVTVKLVEWASLDYSLRIVRQPQLLEVAQIQNNLLLTFGIRRAPKASTPAAPSPIDETKPSLGAIAPPVKAAVESSPTESR